MYLYSSKYWLLYNYTPYDLYFCDFEGEFVEWLVSDEGAACVAGVICFFVNYLGPTLTPEQIHSLQSSCY